MGWLLRLVPAAVPHRLAGLRRNVGAGVGAGVCPVPPLWRQLAPLPETDQAPDHGHRAAAHRGARDPAERQRAAVPQPLDTRVDHPAASPPPYAALDGDYA